MEVPTYKHNLGGGFHLTAYSIDPQITSGELGKCIENSLLETKGKSPANLGKLSGDIQHLGSYKEFSELQLQPSFDKYEMPAQLHKHRDAVKLKFSDSIIVYREGEVSVPGKVIKGEYRDFVSTHLKRVPSQLVPEEYPDGKTIAELLLEWGLSKNNVAKYLGFAHFMRPSNGDEFSFIYRSKNVHIAPDCMAISGLTPKFPEQFNHEGFSFDEYFRNHLADEMEEEYCLNREEFDIGKIHLMNDVTEIPFAVIEITTPLSTEELAHKAYDQPKPKKEHSIFFSTEGRGLEKVLDQFDVFPSTARVMDMLKSR